MATIAIRPLEPRDAACWLELRLRSLREDGAAFPASYDEDAQLTVADVAARFRPSDPANVSLGAFEGERLVGSAVVRRHDRAKAAHRASLLAMYVGCGSSPAVSACNGSR